MKEDHIAQLDNQASLFRSMLQRPQCKTLDVLVTKAPAKTTSFATGIPISLVNDNDGNILNTNNYLLDDILDALCFDCFSTEEDNKRVFNMESNIMPFVSSPIRRQCSSSGTSQRARRKYYSPRRISLPVILEQEDSVVSTSPSSSPQRGRSKSKLYRRYSLVSNATNGCRDKFQSVRRKCSNVLLRLDQPKDKSILTNDFDIASEGRAPTQATFYGSRQMSNVYSVVPRKSHLPHYGFVVQRNPCNPPLRNTKQRRRSNVVIAGCPHQVCRKPNTATLDINRKLPKTKLEKQDNVQCEATSRRSSLRAGDLSKRTNGIEAAFLESTSDTVDASSSYPSSQETSSSENTSDEWTSDSSGSDSDDNDYESDDVNNESDDECDTDSSYTTTTTSSSTSSSSDSDSSSSDSSSDECDISMSGNTTNSPTVSHSRNAETSCSTMISFGNSSSASACSLITGVFENPHKSRNSEKIKSCRKDGASSSRSSVIHSRMFEKSETSGIARCSSESDKSSSASSILVSSYNRTLLKSGTLSKSATFSKSRSNSRSSFSRSSSSSPVKSRRKSRSPTSSSRRLGSVSSSLKCVPRRTHSSSPSARHSPVRKDNGISHISTFRGGYIDLDLDRSESVDKEA